MAHELVCLGTSCDFPAGQELQRDWDGGMVFLSWMVASLGAFTTMRSMAHLRYSSTTAWYYAFVIVSGLAFGGLTVWAAHQSSMYALRLTASNRFGESEEVEVAYGLLLGVCSCFVVWFASSASVWIITGRPLEKRNRLDRELLMRLVISSCVLAAGSTAMHYIGILSMTGRFETEWEPVFIVLGALAVCAAATTCLTIFMVFPSHIGTHILAAQIIGSLICGMHYCNLHASNYTLKASSESTAEDRQRMPGINVVVIALLVNLIGHIPIHKYGEDQRLRFEKNLYEQHEKELQAVMNHTYNVANALVNYDLEAAAALLQGRDEEEMMRPLQLLLRNLTVYRAFLPNSLFEKGRVTAKMPNMTLAAELNLTKTSSLDIEHAVERLRDPAYTLVMFHENMVQAFPELKLYLTGTDKLSSGNTGAEEYQRTLSALYTVFACMRLDIDGKHLMTFGVDSAGVARVTPADEGDKATKKMRFLTTMDWEKLSDLMIRAGIMTFDDRTGALVLVKERAIGMLALTAIHDIMKNHALLPRVQPEHAPYQGYAQGEEVSDHDLALAYILEHYPSLLPSYSYLLPAQRAPVLFTQAKMNFNNGWLVQGEAPPGMLFKTFKAAIQQGRASASDVSFYFVHWITDLAGAETYDPEKPWPGAEKLTVKLPPHVFNAFLKSFSFVEQLAAATEVQVMEDYLRHRFQTLKLTFPPNMSVSARVAGMRLVLMAQGFESDILKAFEALRDIDKDVIAAELARTACKEQFSEAPSHVQQRLQGPAFLMYYAPALIQNAGQDEAIGALIVMAAVFRAARVVFPLESQLFEQTATIRVDTMKSLKPGEIMRRQPWKLRRTGKITAEVVNDATEAPATAVVSGASGNGESDIVEIRLPYLVNRAPSFVA
mmetsp:Transcript_25174/g.57877  ORF Transcript_25174/g.57877 Transcript_25174/m.57877 type:complete len:889 (-) Transcript_25174:35-2701(-)